MYSVAEMAERSAYTELYSYKLASIASQFPGVEIHKQRDLCRVQRDVWNGKYGGYRKDILKESLTDRDEMFLICGICKGIMREACLTSSGEQFCSCCEVRRSQSVIIGKPYLSNHTPNEVVRKMVNSLKCSCPLLERGCEWLGTLNDCEEHLETCGYVRDLCKFGCEAVLHRNELRAHEEDNCPYRKVKCEHCNQYFTFCDLTTHHKECPKLKVSCELKCGVVMCREDMAQHLEQECFEKVVMCPFAKYNCEVSSIKRKYLSQHLEEKETKHLGLKLNAMEDIILKQSEEVRTYREESKQYIEVANQHREEVRTYREESKQQREVANQHREEVRTYREESKQQREEIKQYIEVANQHREEVRTYREESKQQREEIKQYIEVANQHREESKQYREESKQHREEIKQYIEVANQHREESKQHREEIKQYMEEVNQQRKYIDNQIIRINRMSEHINALCSISDTTKLDWNIENLSKFIQINHIPERRNVSGCNLSIHFLKEHIYVSFDDTYDEYNDNFSAKYLICLYSTIKCKVVKQYDCDRVDLYGIVYSGEYEKSQIARISESDAEELSLTGSANKLILEMYITKL